MSIKALTGETIMPQVETMQLVVPMRKSLGEILHVLGEPDVIAANALRRYILDACLQRVEKAEQQIVAYEQHYGSDYETFNRRVGTDDAFLNAMHHEHPMWEADAIEWVCRVEERETWRKRLKSILH